VFVLVAAEHFLNPFHHGVDGARGFPFGGTLRHVPEQLGKPFGSVLGQVKPVHSFGETQVGVDTGNHDACIHGEQLDAHKGHANLDIDDQALVQDRVDDISEAAGRGAVKIAVVRLGYGGQGSNSRESLTGPWLLRPIDARPSTECYDAGRA
jgi:hypothetical protein